jgi:hypothetical protein
MKNIGLTGLLVIIGSAAAVAAPAHHHGSATIDVSVEGNALTIGLEIPLDSTVGFERPPRSDKEKAAYAGMTAILKDAAALFIPTPAANCRVTASEVRDPFPDGKAKPDGHADVDATYLFQCADPAALTGFETTLFKQFKHLNKIDVQRTTPKGQGKAKLSGSTPRLSW